MRTSLPHSEAFSHFYDYDIGGKITPANGAAVFPNPCEGSSPPRRARFISLSVAGRNLYPCQVC